MLLKKLKKKLKHGKGGPGLGFLNFPNNGDHCIYSLLYSFLQGVEVRTQLIQRGETITTEKVKHQLEGVSLFPGQASGKHPEFFCCLGFDLKGYIGLAIHWSLILGNLKKGKPKEQNSNLF